MIEFETDGFLFGFGFIRIIKCIYSTIARVCGRWKSVEWKNEIDEGAIYDENAID